MWCFVWFFLDWFFRVLLLVIGVFGVVGLLDAEVLCEVWVGWFVCLRVWDLVRGAFLVVVLWLDVGCEVWHSFWFFISLVCG